MTVIEIHPPSPAGADLLPSAPLTTPLELAGRAFTPEERAAQAGFPLRVPAAWVGRCAVDSPLWRQVWPTAAELLPAAGFTSDPLEERAATPLPGVIHKYPGRALLLVTAECAIHCRFCFRRHRPLPALTPDDWEAACAWLERHGPFTELILSGGDPLTLPVERLAALLKRLERLPGLRGLRIHTRIPVVAPAEVSTSLLAALAVTRVPLTMVIHCNHPEELDQAARTACRELGRAGLLLLHQGVLLRGINDQVAILAELYQTLLELRVIPYYLHLLDPVAGAAHFQVDAATGCRLIHELRQRLPGYGVPRLVREEAGRSAKTVMA